MRGRSLVVRVTLTTGDDDTSLEQVDAERLQRALCKGFPFMTSTGIEVVELVDPDQLVAGVQRPTFEHMRRARHARGRGRK